MTEVKDVALYLRKSRSNENEETEETLLKHRELLVNIAKEKKFKYVIYQEIGSGDRIKDRPQMVRLLKDISSGIFDAVLVMDIDRLGRGDLEDQGKIKRIFLDNNVLIITPQKVYDLNDDLDDTILDMQSFIARQEYKMIKKRMIRGKKIGSRLGHWTNGKPPLPYKYDRNIRGLVVDQDKLIIYNTIKSMFLKDSLGITTIATKLNEDKIPTVRGKKWWDRGIYNLLIDETHLGKITTNKSKGDHRKNNFVRFPKKDWIVVENCHEAVKTIDEHNDILMILKKRGGNRFNKVNKKRILSGLVYCGFCNCCMQIHNNKARNYQYISCPKRHGLLCESVGSKEDILIETIFLEINKYVRDVSVKNIISNENEIAHLKDQIVQKEKTLGKARDILERVYKLYEEGEYNREEYLKRKDERQNELDIIKKNIEYLKYNLKQCSNPNNFNKEIWDKLKLKWKDITDTEQKNMILTSFIQKIEYFKTNKNSNDIVIKIYFR